MTRTLLTRRWLAFLALATAFAVACVFLGRWQWGRYESKSAKAHAVKANYGKDPVPLRQVLPDATAAPRTDQAWTPVELTGRYLEDQRQYVRNRPLDGDYGYEVVWPLLLDDGTIAVVDRGWVLNGATATDLPHVPAAPTGTVRVTAWVKGGGEPDLDRSLPTGQIASINLTQMREITGKPVNQAVFVLRGENGGTTSHGEGLASLAKAPDTVDAGWINFSYGWQWWLFAILAYVGVFWGARREYLEDTGRARPKVKKTRIWDEEDA